MFLARTPPGPLGEFVEFVWVHVDGVGGHGATLRIPTPDVDLVIDSGKEHAILSGPSTRPFLLAAGDRRETIGAVLRAGRGAALLGVPLSDVRDRRLPLTEVWGAVAAELAERVLGASTAGARLDVLQQVLSARLRQVVVPPHPVAARAAARIAGSPERCRVAGLGESFGLTSRRLEQVFRADVGLTPKAYGRLHRFRAAFAQIDRADEIGWAAFALERGYCDQSHLIREFRAHADLTPCEYLASRGTELNHVPLPA